MLDSGEPGGIKTEWAGIAADKLRAVSDKGPSDRAFDGFMRMFSGMPRQAAAVAS